LLANALDIEIRLDAALLFANARRRWRTCLLDVALEVDPETDIKILTTSGCCRATTGDELLRGSNHVARQRRRRLDNVLTTALSGVSADVTDVLSFLNHIPNDLITESHEPIRSFSSPSLKAINTTTPEATNSSRTGCSPDTATRTECRRRQLISLAALTKIAQEGIDLLAADLATGRRSLSRDTGPRPKRALNRLLCLNRVNQRRIRFDDGLPLPPACGEIHLEITVTLFDNLEITARLQTATRLGDDLAADFLLEERLGKLNVPSLNREVHATGEVDTGGRLLVGQPSGQPRIGLLEALAADRRLNRLLDSVSACVSLRDGIELVRPRTRIGTCNGIDPRSVPD